MQEEIGTGGGGFRYIYAAFLQEASEHLSNPDLNDLSQHMTLIGDEWRDFALAASRLFRTRKTPSGTYADVSIMLDEIAVKEKKFFKDLRKTI